MRRSFFARLTLALVASLSLAACAAGARSTSMVAPIDASTRAASDSVLFQSIKVNSVSGGEETNPMWTSEVSSGAFREALTSSLRSSDMLDQTDGGLSLNAHIRDLKQPLVGFSFTVTAVVDYNVSTPDGQRAFSEVIRTPFTAGVSDAFLGVERLRIANEGAIKENIKAFITRLSNAADADPEKFAVPEAESEPASQMEPVS
ncbi:hypothetical protein [Pyruvatibacter sp.]|nr:hypothetical protein [Alphaproteobacteria bacterium]